MKQRHAELMNRVRLAVKVEHKAMWLNEAARVRSSKLVTVTTRSCDWFSNRVKELKDGLR